MTLSMLLSPTPSCRNLATAPHHPISLYSGVYQLPVGILQGEHPCGLPPDFGEQVQNIE